MDYLVIVTTDLAAIGIGWWFVIRPQKEKHMSKWSKPYFADLAERVGSVAIYGAITLVTTSLSTPLDASQLWPVLGVPVVLSLLKGLLANMADGESGASALPAPPGPEVDPTADYEGH